MWNIFYDPTDATNPDGVYTPYTFPVEAIEQTMSFAVREGVVAIPGMDDVLDNYGRRRPPRDRRDWKQKFRVFTNRNHDAARDLLMAQVATGYPQRLVYQADAGTLRFTTGHFRRCDPDVLVPASMFYHDFTVTWRIRADWRPRYQDNADIWGLNDGVWGTNDGTWGTAVALSLSSVNFTIDTTGTAGNNLPTLPDSGPYLTISGPYGGDSGILIVSSTARDTDTNGIDQNLSVIVPQVPTNGTLIMNCAAQVFTVNGATFRPNKPTWQHDYLRIEAGKVNSLSVSCLGTNPLTGGGLNLYWWRKFA